VTGAAEVGERVGVDVIGACVGDDVTGAAVGTGGPVGACDAVGAVVGLLVFWRVGADVGEPVTGAMASTTDWPC
jgi:hypothetical protein